MMSRSAKMMKKLEDASIFLESFLSKSDSKELTDAIKRLPIFTVNRNAKDDSFILYIPINSSNQKNISNSQIKLSFDFMLTQLGFVNGKLPDKTKLTIILENPTDCQNLVSNIITTLGPNAKNISQMYLISEDKGFFGSFGFGSKSLALEFQNSIIGSKIIDTKGTEILNHINAQDLPAQFRGTVQFDYMTWISSQEFFIKSLTGLKQLTVFLKNFLTARCKIWESGDADRIKCFLQHNQKYLNNIKIQSGDNIVLHFSKLLETEQNSYFLIVASRIVGLSESLYQISENIKQENLTFFEALSTIKDINDWLRSQENLLNDKIKTSQEQNYSLQKLEKWFEAINDNVRIESTLIEKIRSEIEEKTTEITYESQEFISLCKTLEQLMDKYTRVIDNQSVVLKDLLTNIADGLKDLPQKPQKIDSFKYKVDVRYVFMNHSWETIRDLFEKYENVPKGLLDSFKLLFEIKINLQSHEPTIYKKLISTNDSGQATIILLPEIKAGPIVPIDEDSCQDVSEERSSSHSFDDLIDEINDDGQRSKRQNNRKHEKNNRRHDESDESNDDTFVDDNKRRRHRPRSKAKKSQRAANRLRNKATSMMTMSRTFKMGKNGFEIVNEVKKRQGNKMVTQIETVSVQAKPRVGQRNPSNKSSAMISLLGALMAAGADGPSSPAQSQPSDQSRLALFGSRDSSRPAGGRSELLALNGPSSHNAGPIIQEASD